MKPALFSLSQQIPRPAFRAFEDPELLALSMEFYIDSLGNAAALSRVSVITCSGGDGDPREHFGQDVFSLGIDHLIESMAHFSQWIPSTIVPSSVSEGVIIDDGYTSPLNAYLMRNSIILSRSDMDNEIESLLFRDGELEGDPDPVDVDSLIDVKTFASIIVPTPETAHQKIGLVGRLNEDLEDFRRIVNPSIGQYGNIFFFEDVTPDQIETMLPSGG